MSDNPLIRVNRLELLNLINRITPSPKMDREGYSRSLSFTVVDNTLNVFSRNMNYRCHGRINNIKREGGSVDPFCFEMIPFLKFLSKVKDDEITLRFDGSKIRISIFSGYINFENFKRMTFNIIDEKFWSSKYSIFKEGNTQSLLNIFTKATKTSGMPLNPEYKRCAVKNGRAFFWYGNIIVTISNLEIPDFCFRFCDIPAVKRAAAGSEKFSIFLSPKDYVFVFDDMFSISVPFVKFENVVDACMSVSNENMNVSFSMPYQTFKEILGVTSYVCGQFDTISFTSSLVEGLCNITVESYTRTGRSMLYPIVKGYTGNPVSMKFTVDFIRQLLALFDTCENKCVDDIVISSDSKKRTYFKLSDTMVAVGMIQ